MHGFGGTPDIVCLMVNLFITSPKLESHGDLESISSIRLRLQGVFSMSLPWEASDTSRVKRPWRLGCGHVPQINKTWILRPRILQAESQKDCVFDSDHPCWITQVSLALASRIDCWWKTQLATCLLRCLQLVKDGRQIAWGGTWVLCCFQDQKHWRHWFTKVALSGCNAGARRRQAHGPGVKMANTNDPYIDSLRERYNKWFVLALHLWRCAGKDTRHVAMFFFAMLSLQSIERKDALLHTGSSSFHQSISWKRGCQWCGSKHVCAQPSTQNSNRDRHDDIWLCRATCFLSAEDARNLW